MKKTSIPTTLCNKLEDTARYDTTSALVYHKSCVSKFLTKGKCLGSQKRPSTGSSQVPEKKWDQTLGLFLYWLKQCFYCDKDCNVEQNKKYPNQWIQSHLIK